VTVVESSFVRFLESAAPDRLPWRRPVPVAGGGMTVTHGTTVLALITDRGVVVAGDRRATAGNLIAHSRLEKVYAADAYTAIAFAGAVSIGLELIKLFQLELEHYEKLEGIPLTLRGKATRLAAMVRSNLPLALQGLVVVPLLAGHDPETGHSAIYGYDAAGDLRVEHPFSAVGSGSLFAKSSLKKLYRAGMSEPDAARAAIEALYDAADDDTATGGPDLIRQIYPIVAAVDDEGYRRYSDEQTAEITRTVVEARRINPDGPPVILP
jgi:proteasome beta subunit